MQKDEQEVSKLTPYGAGYRKGYFEAVLSVKNWISAHEDCIKYNKMNNTKGILLCLDELINNLDEFIELGEYMEIRVKSPLCEKIRKNNSKST